ELEAAGHEPSAIDKLLKLLPVLGPDMSGPERAVLDPVLGEPDVARVRDTLIRIIETVRESAAERAAIQLDPTLACGMGYYTGPIFEIRHGSAAASIAGGGRYDRMIGKILGRDVPATGFSIGFERVVALLMEDASAGAHDQQQIALLVDAAAPHLAQALATARELRAHGNVVSVE